MPATIDFLLLLKGTKIGIGSEISTVPIRDRYLKLRLIEPEKLLKIERRAESPLVGVAPQLFISAFDISGRLGDIVESKVDPLLEQMAAKAMPVESEILAVRS